MSIQIDKIEIYNQVVSAIAEALMIERIRINPESRIFDDLGAESIDMLDIRFRIEDILKIKIAQNELIGGLGTNLTSDQIRQRLTIERLVTYVIDKLEYR